MSRASMLAAAIFATCVSFGSARAEDLASVWKGKTVTIVVGTSAGGGYDTYARMLGRYLGRHIPGNPNVVVTNMPGAVGRTSTYALCNATLPYVLQLSARGVDAAIRESPSIRSAVNVYRGRLVHRAVADAFGLPCERLPGEIG
jgi:alanine dehydrogenase